LISQLKKRRKLNNSIIILSSDHGESFAHDYWGHGGSLNEPSTRIPLIIKNHNQIQGKIIDSLVGQEDISPTILELANIQVPLWMEGRSLVPLMRDISIPSKPIFSMNLFSNPKGYKIIKGTFAVWKGNYKLIHYLEENKSLLFNLRNDPDELDNLFDKEPEISQRLLSLIHENLDEANENISRGLAVRGSRNDQGVLD